jgi:hypothetical protein
LSTHPEGYGTRANLPPSLRKLTEFHLYGKMFDSIQGAQLYLYLIVLYCNILKEKHCNFGEVKLKFANTFYVIKGECENLDPCHTNVIIWGLIDELIIK